MTNSYKSSKATNKLITLIVTLFFCVGLQIINANPADGIISTGKADLDQKEHEFLIKQHTNKVIIDWQNFNIAPNEQTTFVQPDPDSIALNRIHSNQASMIEGKLSANGKLILINQNGLLFGKDSKVDVNGILATTANIDNQKFIQGNKENYLDNLLEFDQAGVHNSKIINEGQINAKDGLVGLIAPNVINSGIIVAKGGKVQLASGDTFTLDLYGDNLINVAVSEEVEDQVILNSGKIVADGNQILLTASGSKQIINSLIVNTGALQARSVLNKNGEIIIMAEGSNAVVNNFSGSKGLKSGQSKVMISGIIDVTGLKEGESGGNIKILGDNVNILEDAIISASGHSGKCNTTLDLEKHSKRIGSAGGEILIGGDYLGKGKTPTAIELNVESGATICSDSIEVGDAGRIIFWSDGVTKFAGKVYARALGGFLQVNYGNGGFLETSGLKLIATGQVDLTAANGLIGTYLLDPTTIIIRSNTAALSATASHTKINYSSSETTGITEINANYLGSLNADLNIAANDLIIDLAGDQINMGSHALRIIAYNSIKTNSPSTIVSNNGGVNITVYGTDANSTDLKNLTINTGGSNTATLVQIYSYGTIILGNITAGHITVSAGNNYTSHIIIPASKLLTATDGIEIQVNNNCIIDYELRTVSDTFSNYTPWVSFSLLTVRSKFLTINIGSNGDGVQGTMNVNVKSFSFGTWANLDLSNSTINNLGNGVNLNTIYIEARGAYVKLGSFNADIISCSAIGQTTGDIYISGNSTFTSNGVTNKSRMSLSGDRDVYLDFTNGDIINLPQDTQIDISSYRAVKIISNTTSNYSSIITKGSRLTITGNAQDIDFSKIIISNESTPKNNSSVTINAANGATKLNDVNTFYLGVYGNPGITFMPFNQISTYYLTVNPGSGSVVLDLNSAGIITSYANISAGASIQVPSPGSVTLNGSTFNITANSLDLAKFNIIGGITATANITANAGPIVLGNLNLGAANIKALGSTGNITIPNGNIIVVTAEGAALTLNAGGSLVNQNPADFLAIQLVNPKATYLISSAYAADVQSVPIAYVATNPGIPGNSLAGTYDNKDVPVDPNINKLITLNNLKLSGPDANNYALRSTQASAAVGMITPKNLTAVLVNTVGKIYDGSTNAVVHGTEYTLNGYVNGDDVIVKQI